MANRQYGKFTLDQVLQLTNTFYKSRFKYKQRDVLRKISIQEVKQFERGKYGAHSHFYRVVSYSYPQYKPYFNGTNRKGRPVKYQRRIRHQYDIILEMKELSLSEKDWSGRLGSGMKWIRPPQKHVKTIYRTTLAKWKGEAAKKFLLLSERRKYVRDKIDRHKRDAKYLDIGDYNSRVRGINGDFRFRCAYAWKINGHLYGYSHMSDKPAKKLNPKSMMFFPKHFLNLIEVLLYKGILTK